MFFMEQPWVITAGGVIVVGSLVAGLIQTGNWKLLYAAVLATLGTVGLLVVERITLTPKEQIAATLNAIAADLEQNHAEAVLQHISEGRPQLRRRARNHLALVEEIIEVQVKRNLKVEVVNQRGMEIAQAKFNAVIRLRTKGGFVTERRPIPRHFTVRFRREDGRWRIRDYEVSDPREGIGT